MTNGEADGVVLAEESPSSTGQQPPDGEINNTDKSAVAMDTVAILAAPKSRDQTTTPDDFICAVCHELPTSATDSLVTSCCHHLFCKGCIAQSIRANGACPFCRVGLTSTDDMKPLDGIARRVFEAVPVTCSREGCSWEGCVGAYLGHAEECSVSMVSRIDLGRMVRQSQADLEEKTRLHEKCKDTLDDMNDTVNRLKVELHEKTKTVEYYKRREEVHSDYEKISHDEIQRLEKKVDALMEEKADFIFKAQQPDATPSEIIKNMERTNIEQEKCFESISRSNYSMSLKFVKMTGQVKWMMLVLPMIGERMGVELEPNS